MAATRLATLITLALAGSGGAAPLGAAESATAAASAATAATVSADGQRAAIDALIETAVRHGLPDARGAVLVSGKLALAWKGTSDELVRMPVSQRLLFNSTSRSDQEASASGEVEGLHLRLSDGSWLVGLGGHLPAGGGFTVTTGDCKELGPATAGLPPGNKEDGFAGYLRSQLGRLDPDDRAAVERGLAVMPATRNGFLAPLAAIHLRRAGAPQAADLERALTLLAQVGPWTQPAPDATLDVGLAGSGQRIQGGRMGGKGTLKLPTAEEAVRRELRTWALARLIAADDDGRPAALAAALAVAGDQSAADCRRIAEGRALPANPPAKAPLAERVAAWRPAQGRNMAMGAHSGLSSDELDDDQRLSPVRRPGATSLVREADADALVQLLDDRRPSRWIDRGIPRTLGDNALRAFAGLLQSDPRTLAGRDPKAAWNDAERTACATAITAWWNANRAKGLAGVLEETLPTLPLAQALALVASQRPATRARLQAALGRAWSAHPPKEQELEQSLQEFCTFLVAAKAVPEVETALSAWKPSAPQTILAIATWKQLRGDAAALDTAFTTVMKEADSESLWTVLALAEELPTPARLKLVEGLLAHPDDDGYRALALWTAGFSGRGSYQLRPLIEAIRGPGHQQQGGKALRLAVLARVLDDQRPLPEGLVTIDGEHLMVEIGKGTRQGRQLRNQHGPGAQAKPAGAAPATDLRWCDLAGWGAFSNPWELGLHEQGQQPAPLDLTAALAARDLQLKELRELVAEKAATALEEAGLPPLGGKPADAPKSLF
ncbi:MAG: hypothetical protein L6R48_17540 [Planctomycetes bacterium]|nr:hypothetical protein [Planctomycetota bacterium]